VGGSGDSGVMDSAAQRCGDSGIDDRLRWRSAEACARGGEEWSKARDGARRGTTALCCGSPVRRTGSERGRRPNGGASELGKEKVTWLRPAPTTEGGGGGDWMAR
jgi:hypothetical protein